MRPLSLNATQGTSSWRGPPLPNAVASIVELSVTTTDGMTATSSPEDFMPEWQVSAPTVTAEGLTATVAWGPPLWPGATTLLLCYAEVGSGGSNCPLRSTSTLGGNATVSVPSSGSYRFWIEEIDSDGFNATGASVVVAFSAAPEALGTLAVLAGATLGLLLGLVVSWTVPLRWRKRPSRRDRKALPSSPEHPPGRGAAQQGDNRPT
ncbi:MAG: hypothetical protein KGJ23_14945 [Euryarchaeota archaeon]|nr:hypothetical protein [Euryarchaeota archaeon]MDE1837897.1 hypothetical protein [Euryarchaeota archaeon]MDE2046243.1 hypothetical protein [Thermoplasmata archaeon]